MQTDMIAKKSPLQGMSTGTVATVAIRELPGIHSIDLRVDAATASEPAISQALGMELPGRTGQIGIGKESCAFCLAPGWWLMTGADGVEQRLAALKDLHHFSVVDVSDQRTTIELEGPAAREVLAHLWEQDLREKTFPVASVSQGLMAKAPVIVAHMAPHRYHIMVRSSFALHLWHALVDAATEWA